MVIPLLLLQLMAVRKFLRKIHSSPGQHSSKNPIFITPDLYLRVDVFSFQLQDQEFEAKLRSKQLVSTYLICLTCMSCDVHVIVAAANVQ